MKIAIYAIAKNEAKFVKRFCESAKDADLILIADTGSTDNTVDEAKDCGAVVHEIAIKPWRFDKARDVALALVPSDIDVCISLDLDEVLEDGWREEVERLWKPNTTRMTYKFDWSNNIVFYSDKIHSRSGYFWKHPCHEALTAEARTIESWVSTDKLLVTHKPDPTKSRGQYMALLDLASKEDPNCERNAFYHARELTFTYQWDKAITALQKYLDMPKASWDHERSYAMRLIGQSYEAIGDNQKAYTWLLKACAEAPNSREPWVKLAQFCYSNNQWHECYNFARKALKIVNKEFVYTMDPSCWRSKPHDLLAISAYYLGLKDEAIEHGKIAVNLEPDNIRLQNNLTYYLELL